MPLKFNHGIVSSSAAVVGFAFLVRLKRVLRCRSGSAVGALMLALLVGRWRGWRPLGGVDEPQRARAAGAQGVREGMTRGMGETDRTPPTSSTHASGWAGSTVRRAVAARCGDLPLATWHHRHGEPAHDASSEITYRCCRLIRGARLSLALRAPAHRPHRGRGRVRLCTPQISPGTQRPRGRESSSSSLRAAGMMRR